MEEYNINDFKGATWFEDPTKYDYVRMSKYEDYGIFNPDAMLRHFSRIAFKIIGYTKPNYKDNKVYTQSFFWFKEYDRGMPKEEKCYGSQHLKKRFGKGWELYTPTEAVRIIQTIPPKFKKYRIELQQVVKGKKMMLFSLPISKKEFDEFIRHKFEIQKLKGLKWGKIMIKGG